MEIYYPEDQSGSNSDPVLMIARINADFSSAVDKTQIQSLLRYASALVDSDFTTSTWALFSIVRSMSRDVLLYGGYSQAQIDHSSQELISALNNLIPVDPNAAPLSIPHVSVLPLHKGAEFSGALIVSKIWTGTNFPVDKSVLDSTINQSQSLIESDYTPKTWELLSLLLEDSVETSGSSGYSQSTVDRLNQALSLSIDALIPAADKSALVSALSQAAALDESLYTASTWATLQDQVTSGQSVNADLNATQTEVDSATLSITNAISALVIKTDKTALLVAINEANGLDDTLYTSASWSVLQSAVNSGNSVYSDPSATQQTIDAATQGIMDAIAALVPVATGTRWKGGVSWIGSINWR